MRGAYYNENDKFAAAWLRSLIAGGHIAPGDVDERSIVDVRAADLDGYIQCHFFAGIGGWSYALRLAGWPDDRPVWTGSCPCQPFSLAGAQAGFSDDRHLWPVLARLIGDAKPPVFFGEQVASATDWLRLVRSDLDGMGYAVGCAPIEAASAGADHLRDRFWFVGVSESFRSRTGLRQGDTQQNWHGAPRASRVGVGQADANNARLEGRSAVRCSDQRIARSNGMAHVDERIESDGGLQRGGEQRGPCGDTQARDGGDMANSDGSRGERRIVGGQSDSPSSCEGEMEGQDRERLRLLHSGTCAGYEWVIGADGKSRRVKPGIRLLAHGIPNRVGKLRGFGNAIDPRPASDFIAAYLETEHLS